MQKLCTAARSARALRDERVVRRPEARRERGIGSVAAAVDELLRVLDANAELERLRARDHALRGQRAQRVARAVARREHDGVGAQLARRRLHRADPARRGAIGHERLEARPEVEAHAGRLELRAQPRQHAVQAIGADVGARVPADRLGRSARDERRDDRLFELVVGSRVELAVGVGAGAALAEQQVALGIDLAACA